METVVLEKTIIKLGSLLALGFGQAGAQIIEHNMHGVDSACVDAMIEGKRVECIIGAARIRDFSTATEVLQAKVMTFVNQIAEIVHGVVDEFHGYASKQSGDFFLMIWKKKQDMTQLELRKLADMSMLAFARILGAVHRSSVLSSYRGHPGLQQRLGKNCRVNLSTGLHYGWAIEGAVGSEFKIDASYLSPNVSIAETVERATKIYGVCVLVAQSVVTICSPAVAAKCRLIDRVIITGSVTPMELFCIDLDYLSLTIEPPPKMKINWTSKQRFRVRQFLEAEKAMKLHPDAQMVKIFDDNTDIAAMRFRYTVEFIHVFNMGYQNYSQGEWQVAQRLLTRTRTMLGVIDGPSNALLRFMDTPYHFEAPDFWRGIRELGHATG
jgi:class 3 adenylate cyclase